MQNAAAADGWLLCPAVFSFLGKKETSAERPRRTDRRCPRSRRDAPVDWAFLGGRAGPSRRRTSVEKMCEASSRVAQFQTVVLCAEEGGPVRCALCILLAVNQQ